MNEILSNILESNKIEVNKNVKVLVNRSAIPNAYCYGNGILVMNLGLYCRLQNKDQLAFIVSHELSHQLLNHVDSEVERQIAYQDSKEFKKSLKTLKKTEYNRTDKYEEFFLNYSMKNSSLSRKKEREADSLAIVLLKNTDFDVNEALNVLSILDEIDQDKYPDSIPFNKILHFESIPFQSRWLKKVDGLDVKQELDKVIADSLKTHPDCNKRIQLLQNHFDLSPLKKHTEIERVFEPSTIKADFEILQYHLINKSYAYSLHNALNLSLQYPNNSYLNSIIGISLANIYFAQKNHVLRKYVPAPNDEYNFNLHRTLLLIENIRLSELKKLVKAYIEEQDKGLPSEEVNKNQFLLYQSYLYHSINESAEAASLKKIYLEQFPMGYFSQQFNKHKQQ